MSHSTDYWNTRTPIYYSPKENLVVITHVQNKKILEENSSLSKIENVFTLAHPETIYSHLQEIAYQSYHHRLGVVRVSTILNF